MSSLPKSLEITVTKEQPDVLDVPDKESEPSKSTTTIGAKSEKPDEKENMLLPTRAPPYQTGAKKEPGTENDASEDAIASGNVTPSWEGVWRVRIFGVHVSSLEPNIESRDMSGEHLLFRRVLKLATPPQTSKTDFEMIIRKTAVISRIRGLVELVSGNKAGMLPIVLHMDTER